MLPLVMNITRLRLGTREGPRGVEATTIGMVTHGFFFYFATSHAVMDIFMDAHVLI